MKVTNVDSIIPYLKGAIPIGVGTTAICFLIKDNKVLKLYRNTYLKNVMFDYYNMEDKLSLLSTVSNESFIGPEELLKKDDEIIGYMYDYKKGRTLKSLTDNASKENIINPYKKLIKNSSEISKFNIIFFDLHQRNVILSDEYYVIDLDKFYIDENGYDIERMNRIAINKTILSALFDLKFNEYLQFIDKRLTDLYRSANSESEDAFIDLINELYLYNDTKKDVKRNTLIHKYCKDSFKAPF